MLREDKVMTNTHNVTKLDPNNSIADVLQYNTMQNTGIMLLFIYYRRQAR